MTDKKPYKSLLSALLLVFGNQALADVNAMDVNALISQAVLTHPLVGSAVAEKQAAAEGITAAKLNMLPAPSITTEDNVANGLMTQVRIRQPLWTGGRISANINQAIYDDKAAAAYIFEQQNTVAKNTIDIWQNYIYSVALQDLYLDNLARLKEFEEMMTRRVAQGVSARIELDLVTNRILQDQNALQGAIEQQRIAEARLAQMVGDKIATRGKDVPIALLVKYAKEQSYGMGELAFSDISQTSPSVIRQHYQVEAARQEVKSQKAARYPNLYAQYEHTFYHQSNRRDKSNDGNFSWGLSYDPGAGFSNIALARASESRVQSLLQNQEAARRTVMEDIQTQYQQFVSSRDKELSLTAAVAGAQIVTNSYRRQFIAGRKSWLEVLNAVREHSQYQQELLQVQSQMIANFYKLQVQFGMMPWQQNNSLTAPVKEFRPYVALTDWLASVRADMPSTYPKPSATDDITADTADTADNDLVIGNQNFIEPEIENTVIQNDTTHFIDTSAMRQYDENGRRISQKAPADRPILNNLSNNTNKDQSTPKYATQGGVIIQTTVNIVPANPDDVDTSDTNSSTTQ